MPETIPEPTDYAQTLVDGMVQIRDHVAEWANSDVHETADVPLAGGWVVGAINEQIRRFDSEPGLREHLNTVGPMMMRMLALADEEARHGDVRGEH